MLDAFGCLRGSTGQSQAFRDLLDRLTQGIDYSQALEHMEEGESWEQLVMAYLQAPKLSVNRQTEILLRNVVVAWEEAKGRTRERTLKQEEPRLDRINRNFGEVTENLQTAMANFRDIALAYREDREK